MQATEFQPKNSLVIDSSIDTIDKLKKIIMDVVYGSPREIGFELSQPRLAEILLRLSDFVQNGDGAGGSGGSGTDIGSYTILGNNTNIAAPSRAMTVQELIQILSEFQPSGPNHYKGLVPDPGAAAGNTKYLREDGIWAEPSGGGGGGTYPVIEIESTSSIIRYEIRTGTPIVTSSRSSGIQTINVSGGTIKLLSVTAIGQASDLAGDNSFKIICNGVIGTTLLAYPLVQKWNLNSIAPSDAVPYTADNDNTPQVQITAGTASSSITVRVVNLNAFTNWAIKMVW